MRVAIGYLPVADIARRNGIIFNTYTTAYIVVITIDTTGNIVVLQIIQQTI